MLVKQRVDVNFALRHATCLHLTSSNDQHLVPGMITSPFKMHFFRLSSRQADNQLAGKSLLHIQLLGYRDKKCPEYVRKLSG